MYVERFAAVDDFMATVGSWLLQREAEHNLILGLAQAIPRREWQPGDTLLSAVFQRDEVVLVALRAGFHLVLSECDDLDAIDGMTNHVLAEMGAISGVNAPVECARRFAAAWTELAHVTARHGMAQRIYRAAHVNHPPVVPGVMRVATREDRDVLVDWFEAFHEEAVRGPAPSTPAEAVEHRLTNEPGGLVVWEIDGLPVALAGATGPTPNGIRVGPVYTPPDLRNRGYASALVASLTQRELDAGRTFCFLYTDLANSTSNKIYQRIGYEPVTDISVYLFDEDDLKRS